MKILLDKIMLKISIHTPAKGVTDDCAGSSKTRMISIHTPAKGVTEVKCLLLQNWNNFNPHSREGSDMFRRLRRLLDRISIHTPAKGVTWWSCNTFGTSGHFNPHSREGSDEIVRVYKIKRMDFNPHSREGSDQRAGSWLQAEIYFNPHSREGSDLWLRHHIVILQISIHTPAKGVTELLDDAAQAMNISIHTPAKGVTISWWKTPWKHIISIHTPAKGVTGTGSLLLCKEVNFNPHSREGSDFFFRVYNCNIFHFNPHSREGSDKYGRYIYDRKCQFQSTLPRREWQQFYLILGFIFFNITQFYQYHSLFLISFL